MRVSMSDSALLVPGSEAPAGGALGPAGVAQTETASADSSSFARVLESLGRELGRGEVVTRSAIASLDKAADLAPHELLALQAGVYRFSEAIDLASRLVDRAAGSVKTILQGGGQ
jgi:hypothetical protein